MSHVVFDTDDVRALERALRALRAEQDLLQRHGVVSFELDDDVIAVDVFVDRMKATQRDMRDRLAVRPANLTSLEEWKREYGKAVGS